MGDTHVYSSPFHLAHRGVHGYRSRRPPLYSDMLTYDYRLFFGVVFDVSVLPRVVEDGAPHGSLPQTKGDFSTCLATPRVGCSCIAATQASSWRAEVQGQGECEATAQFQKQGVEDAWLTFGEAERGNSREHLRGGGRGM